MARGRLSMRKVKRVLEHRFDAGRSRRNIATDCGVARRTVALLIERFESSGLSWPEARDIEEGALEAAGAYEHSDLVDAFRAIREASLPVSLLTRPTCLGFPSGPARTSMGGEAGPSRRTKRPSLRAGWGATSLAG